MGDTSSCNCCAVAAPGGGPGSAAAGGAGAGAGVAATLGDGSDDGAAAVWSSAREQPVTIGDVDIRTAAASIKGNDRPSGLDSSFILEAPLCRSTENFTLVSLLIGSLCFCY